MKATLLTGEIAEKVLAEKTKRNQKPQGYYDQTAKDLNEVMPGNTVVVKPKGLLKAQGWKKETVLQNCGYRSYDVNVDGKLLRRNRVHPKEDIQGKSNKETERSLKSKIQKLTSNCC